jgi:hypothetical protein
MQNENARPWRKFDRIRCESGLHGLYPRLGGLFVLLLIWRKDVNEGYKVPTALCIYMTISYVFVQIMTASAFQKTIIPSIAKLFS